MYSNKTMNVITNSLLFIVWWHSSSRHCLFKAIPLYLPNCRVTSNKRVEPGPNQSQNFTIFYYINFNLKTSKINKRVYTAIE